MPLPPYLQPLSARLPIDWTPNALRRTVTNLAASMPQIFLDLASDAVPGFVYVNTLDLSQSQFNNLPTTPLVIVPAPGADKTILPLAGFFSLEITSVYSLDRSIRWRYVGNTLDPINSQALGLTGLNRTVVLCMNTQPTYANPPNPPVNTALQIDLSGATVPGAAQNIRAQVIYTIAATPVSY